MTSLNAQRVAISQYFGEQPALYAQWGLPGHPGVDFAYGVGNDVICEWSGRVSKCQFDRDWGNFVSIIDNEGDEWIYAHNSAFLCTPGQQVKRGQAIAKSGATGFVFGAHSHIACKTTGTGNVNTAWKGWANWLNFPQPPEEAQMEQLQNENNALKAQVNNLNALVAQKDNEINALRTNNNQLVQKVGTLEAQVAAANEQISTLTKELENLRADYQTMSETVATQTETIKQQNEQIIALQKQLEQAGQAWNWSNVLKWIVEQLKIRK